MAHENVLAWFADSDFIAFFLEQFNAVSGVGAHLREEAKGKA